MALTAPRIVASIYAIDRGFGFKDIKFNTAITGRSTTFTNVAELKFYPADLGATASGVAMVSIIEQTAKGLNQKPLRYLTDSSATSLVNNGA